MIGRVLFWRDGCDVCSNTKEETDVREKASLHFSLFKCLY